MKAGSAVVTAALVGLTVFSSGPSAASSTAGSSAQASSPPTDLVWLALGDSYSAGEGLPHPDIPANPPNTTCERATGSSTVGEASRAYAVVARDILDAGSAFPDREFSFVACTGDVSDDWSTRWNEGLGSRRADLVTMSYGGNNIGFAEVVRQCVGISVEGGANVVVGGGVAWALNPALGCRVSEVELKRRVDVLVGNSTGDLAQGLLDLPRMYEQLATQAVQPGGHVIVTGYPNLVEEPGRWTWRLLAGNRCHRIRRADASMLRSAAGYLNQQIAQAVQEADGKYNGVRFHWVDVSQIYESSAGRHGLCTGSPWLNGITLGTEGTHSGNAPGRIFRSFHPKQEGHDAVGSAVAKQIRSFDWSSLDRQPVVQSIPAAFRGQWSGVVTSSASGVSPFEAHLVVSADSASLRIPGSDCDFTLSPFATSASSVSLRAVSETGPCVSGGSWQLTVTSDEGITYEWFGPSSNRIDAGRLARVDADSVRAWPTRDGTVDGPSALYVLLGSEFILPLWVSCTDDLSVCIVGASDEVRVYVTNGVRYITSLDIGAVDPAAELRGIGATDAQVDELLS